MKPTEHWLAFDLETCGHPDAPSYLEPVQAARNLKDPDKIAADIAAKESERLNELGLDWNLNRIVAIGIQHDAINKPYVVVCRDEQDEREALESLWGCWRNDRPHVIGFRLRTFDFPVAIQRSRLLGVTVPPIDMKRWGNKDWTDLSDLLTFDQMPHTKIMRETLDAFCRRFGIQVEDTIKGADIGLLVMSGDWEGVRAHCAADVRRTVLLASRIGVLRPAPVSV